MATQRSGTPRSADSVLGIPSLELVLGILERIPGAHSRLVSSYFAAGEYQRGAEIRLDPSDFTRSDEFALALLSVSLFRKYPGLPGSSDKKDKAISKWLECEEQCRFTNERIRQFRIGQVRPDLAGVFHAARQKIQQLLGPFRWSKPAQFFDFGPGSTTRLPYSRRHPSFKYGEAPETTFDNLASAASVIGLSPLWCQATGGRFVDGKHIPLLKVREASKVTTVPKDAFIDRVIAIEPDMNMYVQKGFGGYFRNKLRHAKINLNDQSLNQLLARDGSRGGLATLDLSSASDTVSLELVRELIPVDWYEALLSCRTHCSRLPSKEVVPLEKFSAMGNGFTFELESLIFWALSTSACQFTIGREGLRASVYGDDIIVNVGDYERVVDVLQFAGFKVNEKKSYSSGPYRESCGSHYFHGRDVTPITVTKEITHASGLLLLCNNLTRWALRTSGGFSRNSDVRVAYEWAVAHLPKDLQRPKLPDGYGDGALIGPFDACRPARARGELDGWRVAGVLLPKQKYRRLRGVATLAASLAKLEARKFQQGSFVREMRYSSECRGTRFQILLDHGLITESGAGPFGHRLANGERVSVRAELSVSGSKRFFSEDPIRYRVKLGKMLIPQWGNDIGPWV